MRRIVRVLARLALVFLLVYAAAGYLTTHFTRIPDAQAHVATASLVPGEERVLRGVTSIHTSQSHDATGTIDDVATAARRAGLDFVLIGDHPPAPDPWIPAVLKDSVLIGIGMEISLRNTGRGLFFGMSHPLAAPDTVQDAFWLGAADVAATNVVVHGRSPRAGERWKVPGADQMHGWEIFDLSEMARRAWASPWGMYHVGTLLTGALTGRLHVALLKMERAGFFTPSALAWDTLSAESSLTALAGLNHHPKTTVAGRPFPGYEPFFRTLVNHVVVDADDIPNQLPTLETVVQGIRRGDVFISFGDAAGASGFRFAALGEDGTITRMGGARAAEPGLLLLASSLPVARGGLLYRVVRDGGTHGYYQASALALPVEEPGIYRVEVYRYRWRLGSLYFALRPWLFSNPVRITSSLPPAYDKPDSDQEPASPEESGEDPLSVATRSLVPRAES